jgi:phage protein
MLPLNDKDILQIDESTEPSNTFFIDFEKGRISGFVDEREAVKQAIMLILNTERYKFLIYSWNYGAELEALIGTHPDIVEDEAERLISEALLQDDRITAVYDFEFSRNRDTLLVNFKVDSIYGDIDIETEVR